MEQIKDILKRANTGKLDLNYSNISRIERQVRDYNESEGMKNAADIYDCVKCKNKGYIAFNDNEMFITKPCECLKIRKVIKDLDKSGIGAANKNTFENYNTTEKWQEDILNKAKAFVSEPMGEKWFFIGGQVGAGKTHIGKAIAYEIIKQGVFVQYMEWQKEVQVLNAFANDPEYLEKIGKFITPQILYIDDFLKTSGNSKPTPGEIKRACDIIYQRYNQSNCVIIISSEKNINEIMELDEGTGSRICERAGEYIINISRDERKNYRLYPKK